MGQMVQSSLQTGQSIQTGQSMTNVPSSTALHNLPGNRGSSNEVINLSDIPTPTGSRNSSMESLDKPPKKIKCLDTESIWKKMNHHALLDKEKLDKLVLQIESLKNEL